MTAVLPPRFDWDAMMPPDTADESIYQRRIVAVNAMGKPRARVTQHGAYHTDKYTGWRAAFGLSFGALFVEGPPFAIRILVVRHIPKSWSKKKAAAHVGRWCVTTPDADNIVGAAMDALFGDDSAVVSVAAVKTWGPEAYMDVEIWRPQERPLFWEVTR